MQNSTSEKSVRNKIDKIDEIQIEEERTGTCKEMKKLNVHVYKNFDTF